MALEWEKEYGSGVAGYFDPNENKVVWKNKWGSSVACIWRIGTEYFTSAGFFGGK